MPKPGPCFFALFFYFFQIEGKVDLKSFRVSRSEPAGLQKLRKQVIETKGGPLELRRGEGNMPGEKEGTGKVGGVLPRGRAPRARAHILKKDELGWGEEVFSSGTGGCF